MATDLVFDTHIVNEFISQYFENQIFSNGLCCEGRFITKNRANAINKIISNYRNEGVFIYGMIIISAIAFIEIARKFEIFVERRYSLAQFKSFIDETPHYISVAPIEKSLSYYLNKVPKQVSINGKMENIELPDAIHVATYLSRESAVLLTNDHRINEIPNLAIL